MVIDLTLTRMEYKLYSEQVEQRIRNNPAVQKCIPRRLEIMFEQFECEYCGSIFTAESSYRYCGTVMGCKQDEFGDTIREMARIYPEFHEELEDGELPA